ncbi:MAG: FHA domain-containing protein, partial [Saprospiraceae bacterium]|nr:FHA domain-containing protein [Saprospiraceae bacterium]
MKRVTSALTTGAKFLSGQSLSTFTLLHLDNTQKHSSGSVETIVLPYVELGRSSSCVVQFGDDCMTISRKHAAIERRTSGEKVEFILKHLGANPTLINGQPVKNQWYLSNGDVIQLSMEGPRMRFNTNTVGGPNMKFTERLNLMRSQMAKQHRNELAIITSLFLVIALLGGFYIFKQRGQIKELADKGIKIEQQRLQDSTANAQRFDQQVAEIKQSQDKVKNLEQQNKRLGSQLGNLKGQLNAAREAYMNSQPADAAAMKMAAPVNSSFVTDEIKNNIYYLHIKKFKLISPDGSVNETDELDMSGTGYLLNDNRFVTSRHIVQFWRFITAEKTDANSAYLLLNAFENIGGKIIVTFEAVSPNGDRFTFNNTDVFMDESRDEVVKISDSLQVKIAKRITTDWAVVNAKGR